MRRNSSSSLCSDFLALLEKVLANSRPEGDPDSLLADLEDKLGGENCLLEWVDV